MHIALQVPAAVFLVLAAFCVWRYRRSLSRVYLLDFACYKPPDSLQVNLDMFLWGSGTFLVTSSLDLNHLTVSTAVSNLQIKSNLGKH